MLLWTIECQWSEKDNNQLYLRMRNSQYLSTPESTCKANIHNRLAFFN